MAVTTTAVDGDDHPTCFRITDSIGPIGRVAIVGDGTTTYSFGECGTVGTSSTDSITGGQVQH